MLTYLLSLLILVNGLTSKKNKTILFSRTSFIFLISIIFISYYNINLSVLLKGIALFNGLLYVKAQTLVFSIYIYILTSIILIISSFYPRKVWFENYSSLYHIMFSKILYPKNKILNRMSEQYNQIEYPLIIIFIITGAVFLLSSNDLISVFLSIELQSYGLYLLSTIYRNSELSTNAGLVYFLLGGLSSCIILLGLSLLYINSGTTNLDGIYIIYNISTSLNTLLQEDLYDNISKYYQYYVQVSFVFISVGFLFKIASAPFHFWSPDVYDAIPTIVTTFVSIVAKISILVFLLDLVYHTSKNLLNVSWKENLVLSSLLSLIIGSVLGLTQFRIKRLFAYSTISHVGFILLALSIQSVESIQAFFFYIIQYSISNLNAFLILIMIGYYFFNYVSKDKKNEVLPNTGEKLNDKINKQTELKDINNSPIQLLSQIKGFANLNPMLALSLSITLFSFIGVPPLIGFFGKQMILSAALDKGYVFMSLVAILTSVISAVYYLVVVKNIFFEQHNEVLNFKMDNIAVLAKTDSKTELLLLNNNNIVLSSSLSSVVSIITLLLLLFIFISREWLSIANLLALILFYC